MTLRTDPIRIGVAGCMGRMGQLLVHAVQNDPLLTLSYGSVKHLSDAVNGSFPVTDDMAVLFETSDIVIDFTHADVTMAHLDYAVQYQTKMVIGTTGLNADQELILKNAAQKIGILYASNTSLGVTILNLLVEQAARLLDESYDIEILETHHRHKKDAPSGTALTLGKAAAQGRGVDLSDVAVYARHGIMEERKTGQIGFSTIRGGDVIGDHTVAFMAEGERVEITHKATNRSLFANGALKAAKWLINQPVGLYTMRDVL
jgi:4-hydroxy-tetrahydrodipicolinate reductase